jgi:protein-tyrosine phosphatase
MVTSDTAYTKFEILPNLYLSCFPNEISEDITHVLNMCTTPHPPDNTRTYLHIPLNDIDDITPHIPSILSFISSSLTSPSEGGNKVLVHCAFGINRSVAAVVAYVCHVQGVRWSQALRLVRQKKGDVRPSALFMKQIDVFFRRNGKEGREGEEEEDLLMGFHRRLEERKKGLGEEDRESEASE